MRERALQPQSLLCYEMYGKPLDAGHGAPLRLQMPTKLGYKQAKYIMRLEVVDSFAGMLGGRGGFWEDRGSASQASVRLVAPFSSWYPYPGFSV